MEIPFKSQHYPVYYYAIPLNTLVVVSSWRRYENTEQWFGWIFNNTISKQDAMGGGGCTKIQKQRFRWIFNNTSCITRLWIVKIRNWGGAKVGGGTKIQKQWIRTKHYSLYHKVVRRACNLSARFKQERERINLYTLYIYTFISYKEIKHKHTKTTTTTTTTTILVNIYKNESDHFTKIIVLYFRISSKK